MYILNENNQKQTVLKRGKTWAVVFVSWSSWFSSIKRSLKSFCWCRSSEIKILTLILRISGQSEKINNKPQKNLPWLHLRNKYENMYRLAFSSISAYFYFAWIGTLTLWYNFNDFEFWFLMGSFSIKETEVNFRNNFCS